MINATDILDAGILIVDDQPANVQLMEGVLREAGFRCIASTQDPRAVYAMHRDNRYDLILLDLQMPGMDGFEVMESLKELEIDSYLPVLVLTGQPGQKLRALAAGAKDVISKPFDLMEARARIYNMLEVRLLYKQLAQYSLALESLALHDALTGLPNRRLLFDRLTSSIAHARRNTSSMAVMCLDLDGFKGVNDTLGHDGGDALLRMVADRLVATVREEDTVARLGGDEFVIGLWETTDIDSVARLAGKVVQALSQPYSIQDREVHVTASVGVSRYPEHGPTVEALIKNADLALYETKRAGKNHYRFAAEHAPSASGQRDPT